MLSKVDPQIYELVIQEKQRQMEVLEMIPSENYVSPAVMEAVGSVFMNKYAEGYPGKRYYQGNVAVDALERLAQARAKKLFDVPYVNVQPLSGGPANLEILRALVEPFDVQLSQHLSTGGHLSMGQEVSITSSMAKPVFYHLTPDGEINWEELERLALEHKPKIIWSGGTGYTRIFQWERYAAIAEKVGAYFIADISHIGGLVAGGAHPSPVPFAHVVMTTTHKTLRGPRGAMIMVTQKGITKDAELPSRIDKAVFPGVQGGPHMETVAGVAVALKEASSREFKVYAKQIVKNAKTIADILVKRGYQLIGGGTQNHMIWINLSDKDIDGWTAAWALEAANIVANRQTVPDEKGSPYYPSGLRLGTPAITSRGMKESEMRVVTECILEVLEYTRTLVHEEPYLHIGHSDREQDQLSRKAFKQGIFQDQRIAEIRRKVTKLCKQFPVPGY